MMSSTLSKVDRLKAILRITLFDIDALLEACRAVRCGFIVIVIFVRNCTLKTVVVLSF